VTVAAALSFEPDSALVRAVVPSPNRGDRNRNLQPNILLMHYTGMVNAEKAIGWLAAPESKVSCHYVIDVDGRITQMVREADRAWHAGVAHWAGENDINSTSIGIEIQNPGHADGYHAYPRAQMRAVCDLGLDITQRHGIAPERVLAHSDVAPLRKIDPGEKFDWRWLAREGLGHWVAPVPIRGDGTADDDPGRTAAAADMLKAYGYGVGVPGAAGPELVTVVRAFQRHFRPARVDGIVDASTLATLERLLDALADGAVLH
jgi:N-acetylmuramoyl-L-alanine amidase